MRYLCFGLLILATSSFADQGLHYYQDGKAKSLTPVKNQTRSVGNMDYYKTDDNVTLGVSDTILVWFKDSSNLNAYASEYNFAVLEEVVDNLFLIKVVDKKLTIPTANALYEKDDVKYAHPNFTKKVNLR